MFVTYNDCSLAEWQGYLRGPRNYLKAMEMVNFENANHQQIRWSSCPSLPSLHPYSGQRLQ